MPRLSPARRAERRGEILAAAEVCFASLGFHRATMRDVIAEAGLSAGCVYKHFQSKDEIIAAIAADRHEVESALFADAEAIDDPVEALRSLGRTFIGRLETPEGMAARRVGVQTWAEALLDEPMRKTVLEGVEQPIAIIERLVAHGQKQGRISSEAEPDALARSFVALFHGFVLQKLWQPDLDLTCCLAAMDAMLDGLVAQGRRAP
jgi:AcrR family transcriptional regulator